jgi:AcrR family transcriptional regulator
MNAALRLFSEQGFTNTTVDAIAAAADIGKGTLFNYFSSKEHLIMAFGERLVGKLEAAAATMKPDKPLREMVRSAVHSVIREWHGNQRLLRAIVSTALSNDLMSERFQGLLAKARANVALLMKEGQRRGELRNDIPAPDLARLLQQSMFGAQLIWSLHPASNLVATVDQALDVLWRGIEAEPGVRPDNAGLRSVPRRAASRGRGPRERSQSSSSRLRANGEHNNAQSPHGTKGKALKRRKA